VSATAVEVSPVLPSEYARLSEITVAAYRAVGPMPESYVAALADVAGRAEDPGAVVLAARMGGGVVGGVTVVVDPDSQLAELLEPQMGGMRMLAVDPGGQGSGAGRALVDGCIELCRSRGLQRLSLHTHVVFARARGLYERMGFVRTPERDLDVGDDLHLLSYMLELTPG
jgi:ribosomal protein S18 acetylase RimI-like enzyme